MPEPITAAMLGSVAVAKAVETVVADVYEAAKAQLGGIIKSASVKATMRRLREHAESTRCVKTLWQVDRPVDLLDFYCDSHIICRIPPEKPNRPPRTIRKKVTSVAGFGTSRSVLVQGIAGQGKSILLRYLCSAELARAQRIPLFIELHRIQNNETLFDHITRAFHMLGFCDVDHKLVTTLCETRKLLFFLDGFDEVPESQRAPLIGEIEELDSLAPGVFVISSRPESGIEMSTRLDVERLDNLRRDEYQAVIHKLTDDKEYADSLINRIERHTGRIRDLLCTPLLVTLLVLSYKSYQELPNQLSDFYERIFQDLLQRHDGTKPGFRRVRRCKLNDAQYRQVFDCLCYYAKAGAERSFKYDVLQKTAGEAITKCGVTADPQEFLKDILKVTCLILREGEECRFIHNSVQEYYAASYVRYRTEAVAKTFYDHCLGLGGLHLFAQELMYLREIDPYRSRKYFTLPRVCNVLGCTPDSIPSSLPRITRESTIALIGRVALGFVDAGEPNKFHVRSLRWSDIRFPSDWMHGLFRLDYGPVIAAIENKALEPKQETNRREAERFWVTVEDAIRHQLMTAEFDAVGQTVLQMAYDCACEAAAYIRREDQCDLTVPRI